MEIERKWLIGKDVIILNGELVKSGTRTQGYLSFDPEIRITRTITDFGTEYKITSKSGEGLVRDEFESDINEVIYTKLQGSVRGQAEKEFCHYKLTTGHILECNKVDSDWWYAEIEFETVEEAKNYELPFDWAEVTDNPYWSMGNYCKRIEKLEKSRYDVGSKGIFTPTVGELIKALSRFNENDNIWFDTAEKEYTPMKCLRSDGYRIFIGESDWQNTIFIELK